MTDENTAELNALRERITADGRWWRAVIGFASLIRERLVTPGLSRREYTDDFAFLRIELAEAMTGEAALIEYGVRGGRDSHTVGVVTGRWARHRRRTRGRGMKGCRVSWPRRGAGSRIAGWTR